MCLHLFHIIASHPSDSWTKKNLLNVDQEKITETNIHVKTINQCRFFLKEVSSRFSVLRFLHRTSYRQQLMTWHLPVSSLTSCLCQPSICCHGSVWKTRRQKGKRQGLPSAFPWAILFIFIFFYFIWFHLLSFSYCDFPSPLFCIKTSSV